jgi:hypothetical protein
MDILLTIHRVLGEMVLPLLIVLAAIWFTVTWKPGEAASPAARFLPIVVDIQVTLGLIYYIYLLVSGNSRMLSFPFILHPLVGIIAAGFGHRAVKGGFFGGLGRWAPLAWLAILLGLVIVNVILAMIA